MNAADAGRVLALGSRIQEIQQILYSIDNGWAITSMTMTAPEPSPTVPEELVLPPAGPPEDEEPGQEEPGEVAPPDEERPTEPEEPPPEPEGLTVGEVVVSTEGLQYPPQMLQAIRQQEVQIWQAAAEEMTRLGATNVPQPPSENTKPPPPAPEPPTAPEPARRVETPVSSHPVRPGGGRRR